MTTFKKEFEDKLNELGIKEAFEKNRLNDPMLATPEQLDREVTWWDFIASAFIWRNSTEGQKYWSEISQKR